jgi:ERCC4-related helicase
MPEKSQNSNYNHYISHPLLRKNSVESRAYQTNISQASLNRNTLVILPTALGKTIISLHVCMNILYNYRDRRVLIMAPTRPLVTQHMNSFFSALKLLEDQTAEVTGRIAPHVRRAVWNKPEIRLVFATPEVVKNDIKEDRLSLNDFTLLVFDEAHRAVKDYAYTFIADMYVKQSIYPLILALTASPGSNRQRIQEICDNLFIEHIEYRSEEDPDVMQYVNPVEVEWKWFHLPQEYQYIRSNLKSMLDEKIKWLIQHKILQNGPSWISKRHLIDVGDQIRYNLELRMEEERGPLYLALMQQSAALSLMYCTELIESQGCYSLKAFLNRIGQTDGTSRKSQHSFLHDSRIKEILTLVNRLTTEHPKLNYIVELLRKKNYYNAQNTSRSLIFTQYRDTARHIVEVLSENGIKTTRFVGQAKRQGDTGMKQNEQMSVLDSFRNGRFDVLVATSIAEEGLDIPQVDLVIFYEPIPSEIRYIQRRGRTGRLSAGTVIILAAKDTTDDRYIHAGKRRVEKMKQTIASLSANLKPLNRKFLPHNPLTADDLISVNKEIETMEKLERVVEVKVKRGKGTQSLNDTNNTSVDRIIQERRKRLLTQEEETLASNFRRQVDKTARTIHSLLVKSKKGVLDFDAIRENTAIVNESLIIEALHRLEKLKRIQWVDDSTVTLIDNDLKNISGKTYSVYVEKILQGRSVVMVNGKWRARLNHYDYEGPRDLLKKGSEFKAVGEVYRDKGVLNLCIKQIV